MGALRSTWHELGRMLDLGLQIVELRIHRNRLAREVELLREAHAFLSEDLHRLRREVGEPPTG